MEKTFEEPRAGHKSNHAMLLEQDRQIAEQRAAAEALGVTPEAIAGLEFSSQHAANRASLIAEGYLPVTSDYDGSIVGMAATAQTGEVVQTEGGK